MSRPRHSKACGSALFDVLLSLSIVATLAVASTQTQLQQRRMQDRLSQRLHASALLDAWAERLQMSVSAMPNDTDVVVREQAKAAADAGAASRLQNGRAYEYQSGDALVELEIRWRAPLSAVRQGSHFIASTAARSGRAPLAMAAREEHLSESILAFAPSTIVNIER